MILTFLAAQHLATATSFCPYVQEAGMWSALGLGGGYLTGRVHCKIQDKKKERREGKA